MKGIIIKVEDSPFEYLFLKVSLKLKAFVEEVYNSVSKSTLCAYGFGNNIETFPIKASLFQGLFEVKEDWIEVDIPNDIIKDWEKEAEEFSILKKTFYLKLSEKGISVESSLLQDKVSSRTIPYKSII